MYLQKFSLSSFHFHVCFCNLIRQFIIARTSTDHESRTSYKGDELRIQSLILLQIYSQTNVLDRDGIIKFVVSVSTRQSKYSSSKQRPPLVLAS